MKESLARPGRLTKWLGSGLMYLRSAGLGPSTMSYLVLYFGHSFLFYFLTQTMKTCLIRLFYKNYFKEIFSFSVLKKIKKRQIYQAEKRRNKTETIPNGHFMSFTDLARPRVTLYMNTQKYNF